MDSVEWREWLDTQSEDSVVAEFMQLERVIRELVAVADLGFYGTMENAQRKVEVMNDPVVKGIVEER